MFQTMCLGSFPSPWLQLLVAELTPEFMCINMHTWENRDLQFWDQEAWVWWTQNDLSRIYSLLSCPLFSTLQHSLPNTPLVLFCFCFNKKPELLCENPVIKIYIFMYNLFYLLFCAYIEYSAYIEYTSDIRKCLECGVFLLIMGKKDNELAIALPPELTETAPRYTTVL